MFRPKTSLDNIPDDKYAELLIARGVQHDHLNYGMVENHPGWRQAEATADRILRDYANPRWKSDPRYDAWWQEIGE